MGTEFEFCKRKRALDIGCTAMRTSLNTTEPST